MTRAAVLLLALAAPASCAYLDDWGLGGWTDRLGLSFSDDCQENSGLAALFAWAESWLSGRGGQQRSAHCETKESACPAGVAVTGLQVKGGHVKKSGNRELYDFRLRCGSGWQHGWLGLRFDVRGGRESERGAGVCPEGSDLTGVQVMRGRSAGPNSRDYYTFKLRCAKQWRDLIGLPFEALRETRSATCPHGRSVSGIRVHRGFQDWGSIDTYEFQLQCLGDDADVDASHGDSAARLAQGASGGALPGSLSDLLSFGAEGADAAWQMVHKLVSTEDDDSSASPGRPTRAAARRPTNRRAQVPQQRPMWRETMDEL